MLIGKLFESIVTISMCIRLVNGCSTYEHRDFFTRGCHTLQTRGYNYTEFFPLMMTKQYRADFLLPFYIKTKQDAHVLLSPTPLMQPKSNSTVAYEIVLGAQNNNYTTIRRTSQGVDEKYIQGRNEVSSEEWRRFWIKVTKSGNFSIGRRTNCDEFFNWLDSRPMPVKYFSFSSYHESFGSWAFNCTIQSDLEWYLFIKSEYDRKIATSNLTRIPFTITSRNIDLDESRGIFKLNGTATMAWEDDRLIWEPNYYSQIDNLTIEHQFVTWTPTVELTNIGTYYNEIFGCGNTTIWNNGTIIWTPSVHIKTNCTIDATLWPFDSHTCQINLTTGTELNFSMNYGVEYSKATPTWAINQTHVIRLVTSNETKSSNYQYLWSVEITLTRNLSRNHYSLLVAFIICSLAWFSSLFITATWFKSIKIMMNLTLLLMITTISLILVDTIPQFPQQIPYLFIAYATLFVFCALSSCYSVLSVCLCKAQKKDNTKLESDGNRTNTQKRRSKENDQ